MNPCNSDPGDIIATIVKQYSRKYRLGERADDLRQELWISCLSLLPHITSNPPHLATCLRNAANKWISSEARISTNETGITDQREPTSATDIEVAMLTTELLSALTAAQRDVVELRYGLNGEPPISNYSVIARHTGYSRHRVRRLLTSALQKMKAIG